MTTIICGIKNYNIFTFQEAFMEVYDTLELNVCIQMSYDFITE